MKFLLKLEINYILDFFSSLYTMIFFSEDTFCILIVKSYLTVFGDFDFNSEKKK